MASNKYEGQLDFLGLLNEYKDEQGATVRVRKPSSKKPLSKETSGGKPVSVTTVEKSASSSEQMVLDFTKLSVESKQSAEVKLVQEKYIAPKTEELVQIPKPQTPKIQTAKPQKTETQTKEPQVKEPQVKESQSTEHLFKQCKKCWCFDCKHNSRNEAVPRKMCGAMIPCPACDGCVAEDQATICEIGNAKEGCRFRAIEEGILIPEDVE